MVPAGTVRRGAERNADTLARAERNVKINLICTSSLCVSKTPSWRKVIHLDKNGPEAFSYQFIIVRKALDSEANRNRSKNRDLKNCLRKKNLSAPKRGVYRMRRCD